MSHFHKKLLFLLAFLCLLSACGGSDVLTDIARECETNLSGGVVKSERDSHGGFHNDGCLQIIVQLPENYDTKDMGNSPHWHSLPLTGSLHTFVCQPYDDELTIPEIENGYYYFRDRHAESDDPYDYGELLKRYSFNFTLAIFDADTKKLYFIQYDT